MGWGGGFLLTPAGWLPRSGTRVKAESTHLAPNHCSSSCLLAPPRSPPTSAAPPPLLCFHLPLDRRHGRRRGRHRGSRPQLQRVTWCACVPACVCVRALACVHGSASSSPCVSQRAYFLQMKQALRNVCVRGCVGVGEAKVKVSEALLAEAGLSRPAPANSAVEHSQAGFCKQSFLNT